MRLNHFAGVCVLAAALGGCAAGNTGAKLRVDHIALPVFRSTAKAAVQPPPCPAVLSADILAEPKPQGGFPRPETATASADVGAYLSWLSTYAHWAREGWDRAQTAKTYCDAAR